MFAFLEAGSLLVKREGLRGVMKWLQREQVCIILTYRCRLISAREVARSCLILIVGSINAHCYFARCGKLMELEIKSRV